MHLVRHPGAADVTDVVHTAELPGSAEKGLRRMGAAEAMSVAFLGFSSIAGLTWFFSSRPRLYLRVFVPREEWLGVARWAFRDDFRRSMRQMAGLQFAVACAFGLVGLWLRF